MLACFPQKITLDGRPPCRSEHEMAALRAQVRGALPRVFRVSVGVKSFDPTSPFGSRVQARSSMKVARSTAACLPIPAQIGRALHALVVGRLPVAAQVLGCPAVQAHGSGRPAVVAGQRAVRACDMLTCRRRGTRRRTAGA